MPQGNTTGKRYKSGAGKGMMPKLYFRYGAMGAAKTLNLLAVAHNYRSQGKKVFLMQPQKGARAPGIISTRAGLSEKDDFCPSEEDRLTLHENGLACVLVDEAQFLSIGLVDDLRLITVDPGVPVICYGLRTDFQGNLFPGSKRLMEVADSIEEIKVTCTRCPRKATHNMRLVGGKGTTEGNVLLLGQEDTYRAVCWPCYNLEVTS